MDKEGISVCRARFQRSMGDLDGENTARGTIGGSACGKHESGEAQQMVQEAVRPEACAGDGAAWHCMDDYF